MTKSHDSLDTSMSSPSEDTHVMVGACLHLPKDLRRTLAQYDNDDPLWVLVGPERDDNWNFWMVAYNEAASGDQWVVRRVVWWWGHYSATTRLDGYDEPVYRVAHADDV